MPASSSSDVFSPRHRLPLDPFAAVASEQQRSTNEKWQHRHWEVDLGRSVPRSGLQQQVILILGDPRPSDLLPLLTSPHLSHSLVLIATHAPGSLAIPASLSLGPAVRVLRLAASLNVHDAGALRLVNLLERAQRVARLWRHSMLSGKGKEAAGSASASASQRIIQLAQDAPDGEFMVVEPFAFAIDNNDLSRKTGLETSAPSQSRDPKAEQRSSRLYPSPPPSIASASDSSIPASKTPKKAAHTPTSKSRFSILSLSSSSASLRDSQSQSLKHKKLHKSTTQLSQLVKESAQALENEHVLLNHSQFYSSSSSQAHHAHTRTFDAIVNFLPPGGLPDKALLKCAILVTTLSAQYLALPLGSSEDDGEGGELEAEDEEEERIGFEQGLTYNSEGRSHSLPAHIRTSPTKKPAIVPSNSTSDTISGLSTSPPSSFASLSLTPAQQTPTHKPHRYHYQRRSSLLAASTSAKNVNDAPLPIPPPLMSYPSSLSSVVSGDPQRRFSMMSVFSGTSPSSSSSLSAALRPELHAHASSSTGASRSSGWVQAPAFNATSSQTTPATSPLPSPGLSALSGIPSEVHTIHGDFPNGVGTEVELVAKRKKSMKHRFSTIFGARPDVQWKPLTQAQLHEPGDGHGQGVQRTTSAQRKSVSGSTMTKQRRPPAVNAHIVHVFSQGWIPPEDAYSSSQDRRHSYTSTSSSASQYHRPSHPHHHHRSGSSESAASARSTFGKPKLVQGIEQFLLNFAVNLHHPQQPGHGAYSFSSPGSSSVKSGKRPMTSSGIVTSGGTMKGGWSDPGTRSMSMTKGQLASLVEAEGKKEKESQMKQGKHKRNGRGPPVPFLLAPGVFGRSLMGSDTEEYTGKEARLTIGELVLLGGLDAQSAGRAWLDAGDVVVLGGPEGDNEQESILQEVVSTPISEPVPSSSPMSSSMLSQNKRQLSTSATEKMDTSTEDKFKAEGDEGAGEVPVELGANLLPTPPDSQSSSVRSRSQSHSGSGSSSEESGAVGSEEAEVEVEGEVEMTDDLEVQVQVNSTEMKVNRVLHPTPPERVYSSQTQYAEPPMMITLTSPTVGSPSPPPLHHGHRRLASDDSAFASTPVLPLPGPPPPSSWHGPHPNSILNAASVPHKGVEVPRAIYVSSGSVGSTSRSKSDSRLPLPSMDLQPSSLNLNSESDVRSRGRKRVKSDGFGSALRKLGLGMFSRGGSRGTGEDLKARER